MLYGGKVTTGEIQTMSVNGMGPRLHCTQGRLAVIVVPGDRASRCLCGAGCIGNMMLAPTPDMDTSLLEYISGTSIKAFQRKKGSGK